jgi:tetratricopeptide (TPR) repeat protein
MMPMAKLREKNASSIVRLEDARASQDQFEGHGLTLGRDVHETQIRRWNTRRALAISPLHREDAPLFFESNWSETIEKATRALSFNAPPVTQLALFQLRANAHFELGDFSRASSDVEEAIQLGSLYPYAVSLLYVRTLKVRILARDRGVDAAQESLNEILRERNLLKTLDLDLLLTFLRVQIDLNRLSNRSIERESLACYLLSDAIGDKLYAALAEFDYLSGRSSSILELLGQSEKLANSFSILRQMHHEMNEMAPQSTSCLTIVRSLGSQPKTPKSRLLAEDRFKKVVLCLSNFGIVADLEKNKIVAVPHQGKTMKAIEALLKCASDKKRILCGNLGSASLRASSS